MKLFEQTREAKNEANPLTDALFEYEGSLERGNYTTLNYYNREEYDWTDADEVGAIEFLLKPFLGQLHVSGVNRETLSQQLYQQVPISFAKIAHLQFALEILKKQATVTADKEFESLKAIGILTRVEAGMPVPCIAYLGAIRHSNLANTLKLSLINGIIINLAHHQNTFGALGDLALRTAVNDWIQTAERSGLDKFKKAKVTNLLEQYQTVPSVNEVRSQLSLIETYTLAVCGQLKNGIGYIYQGELTDRVSLTAS